jgi:hypothetical protein
MSRHFRNSIQTEIATTGKMRNNTVYAFIRLTVVIAVIESTTRTRTTAFQSIHTFPCQNPIETISSRACIATRSKRKTRMRQQFNFLKLARYNIEDDDDDDEDDENDSYIDPDSLDDWRSFRKSLMVQQQEQQQNEQWNILDITEIASSNTSEQKQRSELSASINTEETTTTAGEITDNSTPSSSSSFNTRQTTITIPTLAKNDKNRNKNTKYCIENYNKLKEQNSKLADEYKTNVWVHKTATVCYYHVILTLLSVFLLILLIVTCVLVRLLISVF